MKVHGICPIFRVTDLDKAIESYCSVHGFEKEFEYGTSGSGPNYVSVSLGEHTLHVSTFPGDSAIPAKAYLYVYDVDALYSEFLKRGLTTDHFPPNDQAWGMREVYVFDPDGNSLRFGSRISEDSR